MHGSWQTFKGSPKGLITNTLRNQCYNLPTICSTFLKGDFMQTVAIRDLKNNPSNMTKYLENNESVFITKHSRPIGITLPLNDDTLSVGIKNLVAIEQYKNGLISLGKMAEFLEISKQEAMSLVNRLGIDWLDYNENELDTQLDVAKKYAKKSH